MCHSALKPVAVLFVLVTAGATQAQVADPEAFIRGLYRKYLVMDPKVSDIRFWQNELKKGVPPQDIHAIILGSDGYYERYKQLPELFVGGAYSEVLGRTPQPRELRYWLQKLRELDGDRVAWSKEFLRDAGVAVPPNPVWPPADGGQQPTLLESFEINAKNLQAAVNQECVGLPGWAIRNRAESLLAAVNNNRGLIADPRSDPKAAQRLVIGMQEAINAVDAGLTRNNLNAPTTRALLTALQRLTAILEQGAEQGVPVPPIGPDGGLPAATVRQYSQLSADVVQESRQLATLLRTGVRPDWANNRLLRDVEGYATQASDFRNGLVVGMPADTARDGVVTLRRQAKRINSQINDGSFDPRVQQAWYEVADAYDRLAAAAGVPNPAPKDPQPPIGVPAPGVIVIPPKAFQAIDRAIAECDAVSAGFAPYAYFNPSVPRLQSSLQQMRNNLVKFRQVCAANPTKPAVEEQLRTVAAFYQQIETQRNQAARGIRNPPDLDGLQSELNKINAAITLSN